MTSGYKTDQELFWVGTIGNDYSDRNEGAYLIASNTASLSKIINRNQGIRTVIEFGSNIGLNLHALNNLLPHATFSAIETNIKSINYLMTLQLVKNIYHQSILDFTSMGKNITL